MPSDDEPTDFLGLEDPSDQDTAESDEEETKVQRLSHHRSKRRRVNAAKESATDSENDDEDEDRSGSSYEDSSDDASERDGDATAASTSSKSPSDSPLSADSQLLFADASKLKPLSKEELAASKAATIKTGVVYLSRIPVCAFPPLPEAIAD